MPVTAASGLLVPCPARAGSSLSTLCPHRDWGQARAGDSDLCALSVGPVTVTRPVPVTVTGAGLGTLPGGRWTGQGCGRAQHCTGLHRDGCVPPTRSPRSVFSHVVTVTGTVARAGPTPDRPPRRSGSESGCAETSALLNSPAVGRRLLRRPPSLRVSLGKLNFRRPVMPGGDRDWLRFGPGVLHVLPDSQPDHDSDDPDVRVRARCRRPVPGLNQAFAAWPARYLISCFLINFIN